MSAVDEGLGGDRGEMSIRSSKEHHRLILADRDAVPGKSSMRQALQGSSCAVLVAPTESETLAPIQHPEARQRPSNG